jgi:integrase
MIEDMAARKLNPHTQRGHIYSCKRFAAWLKRSPDTAMPDEVRQFQLHLIESGTSICNRNRIMTGVRFLFRVTLRRHDLAAEVWHLKEPERLPPVLSPEEVKRVLTMARSLKARAMLTLAYGCGLRAGEVVRLRAGDIDSEQKIIRIVQSKGGKDRHVMLPAEVLKQRDLAPDNPQSPIAKACEFWTSGVRSITSELSLDNPTSGWPSPTRLKRWRPVWPRLPRAATRIPVRRQRATPSRTRSGSWSDHLRRRAAICSKTSPLSWAGTGKRKKATS